MALIQTRSIKCKVIVGDYAECPNCGYLENYPQTKEYIGGTDYTSFDDIDGVWFDTDYYDSISVSVCKSCREGADWNNWPEYSEIYECLECEAKYSSQYDAENCC